MAGSDREVGHLEYKMNIWKRCLVAFASGLAASMILVQPSWAERHEDGRFRGDIERFHEHDWDLWRAGGWRHIEHGGHFGWWWVAGGVWYFYPQPVYPYPDPSEPPVPVIVRQAPATPPPPPPPPQNSSSCEAPSPPYPYVPPFPR